MQSGAGAGGAEPPNAGAARSLARALRGGRLLKSGRTKPQRRSSVLFLVPSSRSLPERTGTGEKPCERTRRSPVAA